MELIKNHVQHIEYGLSDEPEYEDELEVTVRPNRSSSGRASARSVRSNTSVASWVGRDVALCIDGKTLGYVLDEKLELEKDFLTLAKRCNSVLCVRATPSQKVLILFFHGKRILD